VLFHFIPDPPADEGDDGILDDREIKTVNPGHLWDEVLQKRKEEVNQYHQEGIDEIGFVLPRAQKLRVPDFQRTAEGDVEEREEDEELRSREEGEEAVKKTAAPESCEVCWSK
jgi:hypothetical protein